MRIKKSVSKNLVSYSTIKDLTVKGKRTTKIVERLGNESETLRMLIYTRILHPSSKLSSDKCFFYILAR